MITIDDGFQPFSSDAESGQIIATAKHFIETAKHHSATLSKGENK